MQAFLPLSRLESPSSWEELFCTEFGHRIKIHNSLDDFGPSSLHPGEQAPVEVPAVADVRAAHEPLTGLLEMGKATGSDSVLNEILPWGRPELRRSLC